MYTLNWNPVDEKLKDWYYLYNFYKKKGGDTIIKCEQKHLGNLISKI